MIRDAQGLALSGATAEAADLYDQAVRAFALAYGDTVALFEAARKAAPPFAMGHIGKAWVFALANDAIMVATARALMETAAALPLNERERVHMAALTHAVEGHRAAATAILDTHLMRQPCDLMAHYAAMLLDAFQGRFHWVRDRSARALPRWSKSQPGYGILLSFYGFGLEEAGNYQRSEDVSRAAAELEPHGYWPHHAVSHVMEMTGRPDDGLAWMADREPLWSAPENANRAHIWWHKALFHVELGQYDAALATYDGPLVTTQRPAGISLTNASALLWRLELLGIDAGARWQQLAALWKDHADGRLCVFADIHAAMTAIRAGSGAEVERLLTGMRRTVNEGAESAAIYRDIGLPAVQGLAAFHAGAYADAVEHLLPARYDLWKMGGSHAQRDVMDWTLTEAATRAGLRDVAMALAHERLALRPESAPNRRFLAQAEAIAV
ncbi:MAG: tetratricopeptide repeat protein [Hyphomicrobiaceae bacterium]